MVQYNIIIKPKIKSNLVEVHIFRVVKNDIEFLLLKRAKHDSYPNIWQMVSGQIRKGESAVQAGMREVLEETGLIAEKLFVVPLVNSIFLPEKDEIIIVPVLSCVVSKKLKVIISAEHSEFKWVNLKLAKRMLAWPGQKKAAKLIADYWNKEKESIKFVSLENIKT